MNIEFKHTGGPYGDATSSYDVHFPEGMTVGEFMIHIVRRYSVKHGEWGSFEYTTEDANSKRPIPYYKFVRLGEYKRGKFDIFSCNSEKLFAIWDTKIKSVVAHGGWSNMDYTLYI